MELTKKNCMIAKNRMRGLAYSSCNCKEENIDEVNNCDNYLEQLINEQFDNPPLNQWIPVEERLPELNTKVLVTWRTYHSGNHYIDILYRDEYGRWGCGVELTSGCVVAWMPLPEAYGGKR